MNSLLKARKSQQARNQPRCAGCGHFLIKDDPDLFYDKLDFNSDASLAAAFCNKTCADQHHNKGH